MKHTFVQYMYLTNNINETLYFLYVKLESLNWNNADPNYFTQTVHQNTNISNVRLVMDQFLAIRNLDAGA